MSKSPTKLAAISPGKITSPIPLIVCLGLFSQSIVGIVAYASMNTPIFPYVAIFSLILPVVFLAMIYRLITSHFSKLYAPQDFKNPEDFVNLVSLASQSMLKIGQSNTKNIFKPLGGDEKIEKQRASEIDEQFKAIERMLDELSSSDFLVFHGWFNCEERHELALISIDIAIAKGASDARNFSFRSASLRKLNRMTEARYSAKLALELNPGDADALYNLARCHLSMGEVEEATKIKGLLTKANAILYERRLSAAITQELCAESNE